MDLFCPVRHRTSHGLALLASSPSHCANNQKTAGHSPPPPSPTHTHRWMYTFQHCFLLLPSVCAMSLAALTQLVSSFPIMYYSFQSCLYSFSIRNFRSPVFYCFNSTHGTDHDCLLNTYHCRTSTSSSVLTCPQLEEEGEKEESSLPPSIMSSQT